MISASIASCYQLVVVVSVRVAAALMQNAEALEERSGDWLIAGKYFSWSHRDCCLQGRVFQIAHTGDTTYTDTDTDTSSTIHYLDLSRLNIQLFYSSS